MIAGGLDDRRITMGRVSISCGKSRGRPVKGRTAERSVREF